MQTTPKSLRFQIGIFGKRNAGKSSLLNAIGGQVTSIVSDVPGTTADPVEKAMELPPIGPVLFIDTAGLDDDPNALGQLRVEASRKVLDRCDAVLLVAVPSVWNELETSFIADLREQKIPFIVVFTHSDKEDIPADLRKSLDADSIPFVQFSSLTGRGMLQLKEALISITPDEYFSSPTILDKLVSPHKPVLLITPIDKEAPKGRLIMPQVQTIRDALDHNAYVIDSTVDNLSYVLADFRTGPALAITDSQVFSEVVDILPDSVPLTSFSILLARMKGDLDVCAAGAAAIARLKSQDRVLIAEACTHHPVEDDIGRVKLPRWISSFTGKKLIFDIVSGTDFPRNTQRAAIVACRDQPDSGTRFVLVVEQQRNVKVPEALMHVAGQSVRVGAGADAGQHLCALQRHAARHDQSDIAGAQNNNLMTRQIAFHIYHTLSSAGSKYTCRTFTRNTDSTTSTFTATHG